MRDDGKMDFLLRELLGYFGNHLPTLANIKSLPQQLLQINALFLKSKIMQIFLIFSVELLPPYLLPNSHWSHWSCSNCKAAFNHSKTASSL